MTPESLIAQIKGLEAQLTMLKAQVKSLGPPTSPRTLGDLYGILAGQADSSEEEIDAALYRFDWEDEGSQGAPG
jgi:hypothetical protein